MPAVGCADTCPQRTRPGGIRLQPVRPSFARAAGWARSLAAIRSAASASLKAGVALPKGLLNGLDRPELLGIQATRPRHDVGVKGPRALMRRKLRRRLAVCDDEDINQWVRVLARPWASFTFADEPRRVALVQLVNTEVIDVIIAGPLSKIGMNDAGTLAEVNTFMEMIRQVSSRVTRPLTVILVHHENKGGSVSGAWEGAGDTILHTQSARNGKTILEVQKARWDSKRHGLTLKLRWTEGESFALENERDMLAEIRGLLMDGTPRTAGEIRVALEAGADVSQASSGRDRPLPAAHT